jgi:fructokinase
MIPVDHPAWALEAHYLSSGIVNVICVLSPQRIILGGGVMHQSELLPAIRTNVVTQLGGYLDMLKSREAVQEYIVAPGLANRSGIMGAIAMARSAIEKGATVFEKG